MLKINTSFFVYIFLANHRFFRRMHTNMKRILVSACLIGQNCKYNGGNNFSSKLDRYIKEHDYEVIPVCPEVLGSLPTPRIPAEIVNGIVTNKNGISVHTEFCQGAKKALKIAKNHQISCAVLQSRSPSCGVHEIYDGTFSGKKVIGKGIFARLLETNGFRVLDIEDI